MNTNPGRLKQAHHTLLTKYIEVLNEVSKLPFFVPARFMFRAKNNRRSEATVMMFNQLAGLFSLRYLVKLFTESHIKGKLIELSVAYSYLARQNPKNRRYSAWLKETSEDCNKLAATLSSWQSARGIVSALWPFGIGIATTLLKLEDIYDIINIINFKAVDWINLGLMVFPVIYVALFISMSFQRKRELFMPGFDLEEKPIDMDRPATNDDIIYHLEDQVFNLAGRGKVREIPADVIGQTAGLLGFAAMETSILTLDQPLSSRIFFGAGGVMFLVMAIISIRLGSQRKWK